MTKTSSTTSGVTRFKTTLPPDESSSCRPGTPDVRQVCQDPLFYPYVATFFMFAFGFVIIAAVVMNSLVLFVMSRSTRARKSSHNVYVASLAFSDLMVVLIECPIVYMQFLLPGDVSRVIFNPDTYWVCIASFYFNSFFGTASIMTQLALNIDRYCMIIHPLTTRAFAAPTNTRAGFILMLVWSVSMIPQFGNIFLFKEVASESYVMHGGIDVYEVHFCLSSKPSDNPYTPHVYTATVFCVFYLSTLVTTLGLYVKMVFSLRQRKPTTTPEDDRIYSIYMRRDSLSKQHRFTDDGILDFVDWVGHTSSFRD
ncbi:QRFP-like peptide receptor [Strongylocentrotus purpuratus]|uniref:G-protein coupled receptors family 1 profile domain-containing protein n=1 Tax=Strongylocentrotus purpuratus TaxID=7668 RepID=A0A7M7NAN5_STRPU|nr:QRFP-like peptide receptor [Strongylocentrotus purpuratus]